MSPSNARPWCMTRIVCFSICLPWHGNGLLSATFTGDCVGTENRCVISPAKVGGALRIFSSILRLLLVFGSLRYLFSVSFLAWFTRREWPKRRACLLRKVYWNPSFG